MITGCLQLFWLWAVAWLWLGAGLRVRGPLSPSVSLVRLRLHDATSDSGQDVETTRAALMAIIDESWRRVRQLTKDSILSQCEDELRSATSLLVLASVRRAAEHSELSRATAQRMFTEADVNKDGQLTFLEWYEWLGKGGTVWVEGAEPVGPSPAIGVIADPMVAALQQVLSQALCTLKISARVPSNRDDPLALSAAFIAGGIMAGVVEPEDCRALLGRLSPRTRELVSLALALESASASTPYTDGSLLFTQDSMSFASSSGQATPLLMMPPSLFPSGVVMDAVGVGGSTSSGSGSSSSSSERRESGGNAVKIKRDRAALPRALPRPRSGKTRGKHATSGPQVDAIQIVDLSTVVAAVAPGIDSPVPSSERNEDKEEQELFLGGGSDDFFGVAEAEAEEGRDEENDSQDPVARALALEGVLQRVAAVVDEVTQLRSRLADLEDSTAASLRMLLARKTENRQDVSTLAMALRATRLQHVHRLPVYLKHQLAVETLQLWAPLSFQAGVSAQIPELEVHSYVLLFPRSFSSFVGWYQQLRPIARRILRSFRHGLEEGLRRDRLLPQFASRVTLQTRLKQPSSAFKKLVRGAKPRNGQLLHDMLGVRVIVEQRRSLAVERDFEGFATDDYLDDDDGGGGDGDGGGDGGTPLRSSSRRTLSQDGFIDVDALPALSSPSAAADAVRLAQQQALEEEQVEAELVLARDFESYSDEGGGSIGRAAPSASASTSTSFSAAGRGADDPEDFGSGGESGEDSEIDSEIVETRSWKHSGASIGDNNGAAMEWEAASGGDDDSWAVSSQSSSSSSSSSLSASAAQRGEEQAAEVAALWRAYALVAASPGWREDRSRFKDYVNSPKPSGYQSLHVVMVHDETQLSLEVQIRSKRMHELAETGSASHGLYKARLLSLPPASE